RVMKSIHLAIFVFLMFVVTGSALGEQSALKSYPESVQFLDVPVNAINGRFALRDGVFYGIDPADAFTIPLSFPLPPGLSGIDAEGTWILGAPAIVLHRGEVDVSSLLPGGDGSLSVVGSDGKVLIVQETRENAASGVSRVLTVFSALVKQDGVFSRLAR